ncbi:MAG: hypothetical protein EZS28_002158 [Streblomastix strix]|uniref:Uncharacterized protein n=1 Tax=Streblomastix strix TaxID=222440 RepID=A0A5J4X5N2_9EUKA|nr:MAG: hypothetical protein EZS28_002158 [Streblomastix strix]
MEHFDFLIGWEDQLLTAEKYDEVTPHPWLENEYRTRCQFFCKGVFKVCIYSKCNESGELLCSSKSSHRYLHCCCSVEGETCKFEKRIDHLKSNFHPDCIGNKLYYQQIKSSSERVNIAVARLSRIHGVPFEVCASKEMTQIQIEAMNLQKSFLSEKPETLLPHTTAVIIRKTMIEEAHMYLRERLSIYQGQIVTLILDGGLLAHVHVVVVLITSPIIDAPPALICLYTGPVTADGFARLVAQITKDLKDLDITVGGFTTDGHQHSMLAYHCFQKKITLNIFQKVWLSLFSIDVQDIIWIVRYEIRLNV